MTITSIPDNDRKERFIATAGQTIFPFDFPIFAATDLQVKRERTGVESTLILGTDYTLTGAGEQAGGNITLTTGAQLNDIIVLLSAMPSGRTTQYVNGGDLPAAALESDFARLQILLQQILRDARAGLLYPQTDGPMPDLPPIASRAGRFLAFDAQGQPYAAGAPGTALDAVARAGDTMTGPLRIAAGSAAAPGLTPAGDTDSGIFAPAADEIGISLNGQEVARFNSNGLTMTGPLRIAAGSAAAPGLTPAGDTNSGIFAPAADEIGISLNGQEVARFNSNGLVGRLVPRTWLDVASAATIDLGAQNADSLRLTGTTTITSFGTAVSGTRRRLRVATGLTITHNATSLFCPGAANLILGAGDIADVESLGSGNWIVTAVQRANSFGINRGTRIATNTGQVQYDLTDIPAGVRRITLVLNQVSTNGGSIVQIQLGSTTFTTSGYASNSHAIAGTAVGSTSAASGHIIDPGGSAAFSRTGFIDLFARAANEWYGEHKLNVVGDANPRLHLGAAASPVLAGALDRIRLTTVGGTDTFDSGNIDIAWEF